MDTYIETVKKLKFVIAALLVLLAIIVVNAVNRNPFSEDTQNTLLEVKNNKITVTQEDLRNLPGNFQIIVLDKEMVPPQLPADKTLQISFEQFSERETLKQLKSIARVLVIYSSNPSQAVKAWVILTQSGIRNAKILDIDNSDEKFLYTYPSDSVRQN